MSRFATAAALVLAHLAVTAVVVVLLVAVAVADWGYAEGGAPDLESEPALLLVPVLLTVPVAALEAWAVLVPPSRSRGWLTAAAAALAAAFHGLVGSLPATFNLAGSGPVLRGSIRWAAVDSALIVGGHVALVVLGLGAWAALTRPGRAPA